MYTDLTTTIVAGMRQTVSDHHADLNMVMMCATDIMLQPLSKQCLREVERSATHWFLCYWRFCHLMMKTRYVMLMSCQ